MENVKKIDYKKEYKDLYMPKAKPTVINVPKMKFISVEGKGNPNTSLEYKEALEVLYGISYTIKMSKMGTKKLNGYFEYVVPPLEGLWTTEDHIYDDKLLNKEKLIWKSMIRQPEFVTEEVFSWAKEELKKKKVGIDLSKVKFEEIEEGLCIQIMHRGSYDTESTSFGLLKEYLNDNGYKKVNDVYHHHEIYITDPRKSKAENNKTVIRYSIEKI